MKTKKASSADTALCVYNKHITMKIKFPHYFTRLSNLHLALYGFWLGQSWALLQQKMNLVPELMTLISADDYFSGGILNVLYGVGKGKVV